MTTSQIIDAITVILSLIMLIRNIRKATYNSRYVIYLLFFLFYVVPLVLDVIYMQPGYIRTRYHGFKVSSEDNLTRILYDIFLMYCQILLLQYKKSMLGYIEHNDEELQIPKFVKYVMIIFILLPVLVILAKADIRMLYTFQWRENGILSYTSDAAFAEKLSYAGVLCSILLISQNTEGITLEIIIKKILLVVFLYMNICIQGKRGILFFAIVVYALVLLPGLRDEEIPIKNRVRKLVLFVVVAFLAFGGMIFMTVFIKINDRGYDPNNVLELYTQIRIDFFRDDRVRMAIYSVLYPGKMTILKYPGQTIFPIVTWLFPVDYILGAFWGLDMYSYQTYFSAALQGMTIDRSAAFMTPCIFAELISNFEFIGFAVAPLIMIWFSNKANRYGYPMNILVITGFVLLQMFAIKYLAYCIEAIILIWYLYNRKWRFTFELGEEL